MKSTVINTNDSRVLKTKASFMKAFKELILVYDDYMSITVKELCDKANLNRKTFYLHYKQVDDLFVQLQNEAIDNFFKAVEKYDLIRDVDDVILAYFNLNESNPVYQKLSISPHYIYIKETSRKKAFDTVEQNKTINNPVHDKHYIRDYVNSFYYYSGYIAYMKWVRSNRAIPKEEAVKIAASLIKNGISAAQSL